MKIQYIPIKDIFLDLENPRSKYSDPNEEQSDIFDEVRQQHTAALLRQQVGDGAKGYSVNALKQSIVQTGAVVNPIWIKSSGKNFICIEGNTRLCIYKDLNKENPEDSKWQTIPAIVYEDISKEEENKLKLTAHIVGTREWKPYNKAKYVIDLLDNTDFTFPEISEIVGGQVGELSKQIAACRKFDEHFLPKAHGDKSHSKFSHFIELEKNPSCEQALKDQGLDYETFSEWVLDNKFVRAINVRDLKAILENDDARKAFEKDGYASAKSFLQTKPELDLGKANLIDLSDEIQKKLKYEELSDLAEDKKLILSLLTLGADLNTMWEKLEEMGIDSPENSEES